MSIWLPPVLMAVVLGAVLYAASEVNKSAQEEMILHFQERQEIIARQFALGMETIVGNSVQALERMAKNIHGLPIADDHVREELLITWHMLSASGLITRLDATTLEGEVVRSFSVRDTDFDQSRVEPAKSQLREVGRPVASDIFRTEGGEYVIFVAVPVMSRKGRLVGELSGLISIGKLMERVFSALKREEIGAFWILTAGGSVVYHSSHPEMALRNVFSPEEQCLSCHPNFDIERRMVNGLEGRGRTSVRGQENLVAYTPIRVQDMTWSIAISNPVEVATGLLQNTTGKFVLLMALFLGVFFLGGWLVVAFVRRAIKAEEKAKHSKDLLDAAQEREALGRELEQANRMAVIGEMVARVAHELRNPIQYMGTGCELLTQEREPEGRKVVLDSIRQGLGTINAIVQELLNFSRPMKLERFPVNLIDLVHEIAADAPENVRFVSDVPPSLPHVSIDGMKIKQLLSNLVANAVDAIGQAGTITVSAAVQGGELLLSLRDTGCGMAEETIDKIYQPFFTTKNKGVGLGMSIVQRIVALHGGSIEVRSRQGEGTEFRISIPISDSGEDAA